MGVPEPPCWAGGMSPGVPSSPQARMSPLWPPAAAGCADAQQITPALTLWCRGALSQQAPGWYLCPAGRAVPLSTHLLLPSTGSSAALSMTLWLKLAGLTRGQQRTSRRLS